MPPLRVGKARDSLGFEYRLRDFSPPHTHAPSACANCHADLLRFLPVDGPASDCCTGEFAPASGRKQRSDAVRLRKCRIGVCPSRAADKDAQQDWGRPEVWPRIDDPWPTTTRSIRARPCDAASQPRRTTPVGLPASRYHAPQTKAAAERSGRPKRLTQYPWNSLIVNSTGSHEGPLICTTPVSAPC
jgi:hypothetical protein